MTKQEIYDAVVAAKIFLGMNQWTESSGSDVTAWNSCKECGEDDFRGHKENCPVPKIVNNLDTAILELKPLLLG